MKISTFFLGVAIALCLPWTPHISAAELLLSPADRAVIAGRRVAGLDDVPVMLAAQSGQSRALAAQIKALGGRIVEVEQDIDFVMAEVPIERMQQLLSFPQIAAVEVATDGYGLEAFAPPTATRGRPARQTENEQLPGIPPTQFMPADNPYTSGSTTEALPFKAAHLTYDGRGVTIGTIEALDPRIPSLTWAFDLQGARIPKIADYIILPPYQEGGGAFSPAVDEEAAPLAWRKTEQVHADGQGHVVIDGERYDLPRNIAAGELRAAVYRIRWQPQSNDATAQAPGVERYTVLWSVAQNKVWICPTGEHDFAHGIAIDLPSGPVQRPLALLGRDGPVHGIRARPLLVKADKATRQIGLFARFDSHGAMCASLAAGHSFMNSQAEGVAPGAQVLVIQPTDLSTGIPISRNDFWLLSDLAAIFDALRDPRTDIETLSALIPDTRDGIAHDVDVLLMERLLARQHKLLFCALGNGNQSFQDNPFAFCKSDEVISTASYISRESWEANMGVMPTARHTTELIDSVGPARDGGLKPQLLGQVGTLTANITNGENGGIWRQQIYYDLPADYQIAFGTSSSAPSAAGNTALLISAAKQAGVPHDAARLGMALYSSAKFLDGVQARVQGYGLIQVAQAWEALQKLAHYTPLTFTTRAPVRTFFSPQFDTPNVGRGLYEVGWRPGERGLRKITITRTSGPRSPILYKLRWLGDTGVFTSPVSELRLGLNEPVELPVRVRAGAVGAYSAIVELIDPGVGLVAHGVLCTIMVAEPLNAHNGYSAHFRGTIDRPGSSMIYVDVPPGSTALRVEVDQRGGHVGLYANMPNGEVPNRGFYAGNPSPPLRAGHLIQTYVRPMPGVWQIRLANGETDAAFYDPDAPRPAVLGKYTMSVTAYGASSEGESAGAAGRSLVTFTNVLQNLEAARIRPLGLGSARTAEPVLRPGLQQTFFDVLVPEGATRLEVDLGPETAVDADVSLIVFDAQGSPIAHDYGPGATKHLELHHLAPGRYKIALDPWNVPGSGVRLRYRDVVYHRIYGKVIVDDSASPLERGATKTANVSYDIQAEPAEGRHLVAELGLFSDELTRMKFEFASADTPVWWFKPRSITHEPVPVATQLLELP